MDKWKEKAEKWFRFHMELSHNFDTKLADYYASDAYLQNTVVSDNGEQQHRVMPVSMYKFSMAKFMGIAKDRGDTYDVSDIEYELDGYRAVIRYIRHSHLSGLSSPVKVVIGLFGDEEGLIFAEYSISSA